MAGLGEVSDMRNPSFVSAAVRRARCEPGGDSDRNTLEGPCSSRWDHVRYTFHS